MKQKPVRILSCSTDSEVALVILTLQLGLLQTNCYIVASAEGTDAAVIDPVDDAQSILAHAASKNLHITHILLTHGHFDHILALSQLKHLTGASVAIHRDDAPMLVDAKSCLADHLGLPYTPAKPDTLLSDGEEISVGDMRLKAIQVVGHTDGSLCYYVTPDDDTGAVFTGDTLFAGAIGRTDLSGSDVSVLSKNIVDRLLVLPGTTRVFPGHGPSTTIEHEKKRNPYLISRMS